jgi:hypothetical protein
LPMEMYELLSKFWPVIVTVAPGAAVVGFTCEM